MVIIKKYKLYLLVILLFVFYLITLPYINELIVPCLKPIPSISYTDQSCNLNLALDRYLLMAMTGFITSSLIMYFLGKRKAYVSLSISAIIIALMIFISFNLYIKTAEKEIREAPIILDSIKK